MSNVVELEPSVFGTTTLGALIDALYKLPAGKLVRFDFCDIGTATVHSYRGYYDHLAIGWKEDSWHDVRELYDSLKAAVGQTYQGYKGGIYKMDRDTPVWVSNYGRNSRMGIVGLSVDDDFVTLTTTYVD